MNDKEQQGGVGRGTGVWEGSLLSQGSKGRPRLGVKGALPGRLHTQAASAGTLETDTLRVTQQQ